MEPKDEMKKAAGQGWIDCKQELPPEPGQGPCEQYLITFTNKGLGPYVTAAYYGGQEWWEEPHDRDLGHLDVTHWQPLPAPPSGEQSQPSVNQGEESENEE